MPIFNAEEITLSEGAGFTVVAKFWGNPSDYCGLMLPSNHY
jgi:hypothetical protein